MEAPTITEFGIHPGVGYKELSVIIIAVAITH